MLLLTWVRFSAAFVAACDVFVADLIVCVIVHAFSLYVIIDVRCLLSVVYIHIVFYYDSILRAHTMGWIERTHNTRFAQDILVITISSKTINSNHINSY